MTKKSAAPKAKRAKEEVLHIRLDSKTKFALDLIGRQTRHKYTQIMEEAIEARADALKLGTPWINLWDEDEGVRMLNLLACPTYNATPAERELQSFVRHHREFFYVDDDVPHRGYALQLWKDVDKYLRLWLEQRHTNHWVAAEAMEDALRAAKVKPPKYGDKR